MRRLLFLFAALMLISAQANAFFIIDFNEKWLREDAYKWVQRNAMKRWMQGEDFRTNIEKDPDIIKYLSKAEIEECFDYKYFLRHVDMIMARFGL